MMAEDIKIHNGLHREISIEKDSRGVLFLGVRDTWGHNAVLVRLLPEHVTQVVEALGGIMSTEDKPKGRVVGLIDDSGDRWERVGSDSFAYVNPVTGTHSFYILTKKEIKNEYGIKKKIREEV